MGIFRGSRLHDSVEGDPGPGLTLQMSENQPKREERQGGVCCREAPHDGKAFWEQASVGTGAWVRGQSPQDCCVHCSTGWQAAMLSPPGLALLQRLSPR